MTVRHQGAPPLALAVLCALISFTHAFLPLFQLGLRQQPALGLDRQVWTHGTHAPRRRLLPVMMDGKTEAEEEKGKNVLASELNEAEQLAQIAKEAAAEAEAAKQKALGMKNSALGELAATARKYKQEQEAGRLRRDAELRVEEDPAASMMADGALPSTKTPPPLPNLDVDKSVKSLINDRSLESKFVEISKNANIPTDSKTDPRDDEKDEDAAFGLPGKLCCLTLVLGSAFALRIPDGNMQHNQAGSSAR
eukprot:2829606-Rhodomonas_salina.1